MNEPLLKKRERPTDAELADIQGEHLLLINRGVPDPYQGKKLLGDLWAERIMRDHICASYEELQTMHSRDKEATLKAEQAADAYITRLEARLKQREERIHELSREITNYLNNGDVKLRAQVAELEQELDASKRFYANLLVNSGKEIRRLEGLLNAMCGPGTAETMRHENL